MTLVKSMHEQVKSCVKSKSGLTYFFKYKRGVRQGCLLSPVLFSLFLNDLQGYLLEGGANGITLWDIKIFSLLYADDLVLIAESEVKSMHEQVKSCVKSKSGLTYFFKYKRGVRQGCLLSPVLFSLFLNDLQGYLLEGGANGITLWDIKIFSLLYADDLVLIAESEEDLKLQMRIPGSYSDDFEMEINPKKTSYDFQ